MATSRIYGARTHEHKGPVPFKALREHPSACDIHGPHLRGLGGRARNTSRAREMKNGINTVRGLRDSESGRDVPIHHTHGRRADGGA